MEKIKTEILVLFLTFPSLAYANGEKNVVIGGSEILYVLIIFLLPKKANINTKIFVFYIMSFLFYVFSNFTLNITENNFIKYNIKDLIFFIVMFILGGMIFYQKPNIKNILKRYIISILIICLCFYLHKIYNIYFYFYLILVVSVIYFLIISIKNAINQKYIIVFIMSFINILPSMLILQYLEEINKSIDFIYILVALNLLSLNLFNFKKKIANI